ncbi:MAG: HAD family phosphatase [Candidatus Bipolaricaulota bacterium]|nr:HAD family phosphatase [Candidatus Bipolaricaulota bacterium]
MTWLRAVLFDMDGTIFDSRIDLGSVRQALRLPRDGRSFLEQLSELPPAERERGMALLVEAEMRGSEAGRLIPGAEELVALLRARGVRCALITNNSRASAEAVLRRYPLAFDLVLTRDDGAAKPDPAILTTALARLGVEPRHTLAIGDAHLDLIAAHRAGIGKLILVAPQPWVLDFVPRDIPHQRAADLYEVREIVERLVAADSGE